MALNTLSLVPDSTGYSYADGSEVISVQLAGGAPRIRADVLGAWGTVEVQWTLDATDYATLRTFYATNKALPFVCTLTIEDNDPTSHKAMFVPGSFKLKGLIGNKVFVQGAQLFVDPAVYVEPEE